MTDLPLQEVADLRGVSIWTVRKWVQRKQLKAIKKAGAYWVDAQDAINFIPPRRGPKGKKNVKQNPHQQKTFSNIPGPSCQAY